MNVRAASAPGKAILLGEHGVNRGQPALVTAIDRRVVCTVSEIGGDRFRFRSGARSDEIDRSALLAFKREIDAFRDTRAYDALNARAISYFAPAQYVLAHLLERCDLPALEIGWESTLASGSGLGSGAAASAALAHSVLQLAGRTPDLHELAWLAWQGDVIAHGGIASGLDSGGCALGGVTRYTVTDGPKPIPAPGFDALVIAHTGVTANTAAINTGVRRRLQEQPALMGLFDEMGALVERAEAALAGGDLPELGRLMNLGQDLLRTLGVSSPEIERLVAAARNAGALGAKLTGSGGGGIVVALPPPGGADGVLAALAAAGAEAALVAAGAPGARSEESGKSPAKPAARAVA